MVMASLAQLRATEAGPVCEGAEAASGVLPREKVNAAHARPTHPPWAPETLLEMPSPSRGPHPLRPKPWQWGTQACRAPLKSEAPGPQTRGDSLQRT